MNHVARMEVVEALNDVGQLVAGVSVGQMRRERHLQAQVCWHGVPLDVFWQFPARHPIRNEPDPHEGNRYPGRARYLDGSSVST
jgi:hypothetical protein